MKYNSVTFNMFPPPKVQIITDFHQRTLKLFVSGKAFIATVSDKDFVGSTDSSHSHKCLYKYEYSLHTTSI